MSSPTKNISSAKKRPLLAGVIGRPIAHSLSPHIHRFWADREGVEAYYTPLEGPAAADDFVTYCNAAQRLGYRGLNVTLPFKEIALKIADEATPVARRVGAANMLTFKNGRRLADNSDVVGFRRSIEPLLEHDGALQNALIIGAGGAAGAIVCALKNLSVGAIAIANRTAAKAERLAQAFDVDAAPFSALDELVAAASIIVNTTSLGMTGMAALPVADEAIPRNAVVSDIVYAPLKTSFLAAAEKRGARTVSGLSMLMHQAAPGYRAWLGDHAEVDADLEAHLMRIMEARNTAC